MTHLKLSTSAVAIWLVAGLSCGSAMAASFGAPVSLPVDGAPIAVVAADVDDDGALDLITANQSGSSGPTLSILLGHGNGSFANDERISINGQHFILSALAAADFDGDGLADIAVGVDDIRVFPPRASVLVYRNSGEGLFRAPELIVLDGVLTSCLEAGDLDGDGRVDLIVCHATVTGGDGAVSILRGTASGALAAPTRVVVGSNPSSVRVADVDRDGRNDLLVVDSESESLFVMYGTAGAQLVSAPEEIPDAGTPRGVAVLSTATLPALLVASGETGELLTLEQTTPRQFELDEFTWLDGSPTGITWMTDPESGAPLAVLPMYIDNRVDVMAIAPPHARTTLALDTPSGVFVADFDGDGRDDLVATSQTTDEVRVWLAGSDPVPTPSVTPTPDPEATLPSTDPSPTPPPATSTSGPGATPTPTPTCVPGGPCGPDETPTAPSTPTATATATETPTPGMAFGEPGDANCDGVIDAMDAYAIFEQLFLQNCSGADLNGDGIVTSADIILLILGETFAESELLR